MAAGMPSVAPTIENAAKAYVQNNYTVLTLSTALASLPGHTPSDDKPAAYPLLLILRAACDQQNVVELRAGAVPVLTADEDAFNAFLSLLGHVQACVMHDVSLTARQYAQIRDAVLQVHRSQSNPSPRRP